MPINPKIFKKYDIRGKATGDKAVLTTDVAYSIGRAFATYLQTREQKTLAVVGRDNRITSFDLQKALADGLQASGCDVIDLGLVATPLVYWHAVNQDDSGGIMITGSHLTADQNGFKLCVGNRTLYGSEIQGLRRTIDDGRLYHGSGTFTTDNASYSSYIRDLEKRIKPSRSLKVIIDAGNGVGGLFGPRLFELWGHEIMGCMYCEPDANFPNHQPNPQEAENMRDLAEKVRFKGADIGIAFDGDADRIGAVDENGNIIAADRLLALLAIDMLKRHPGEAVVADVLSSQVLFDAVAAAGGKPFMAASGHSLVKEQMRDKNALLGGEMSGHIFLGEDYFGFDDGFLAAGRLLQLVAESDRTLSQLDDELPRLYSTPEYRPHCPESEMQKVIDSLSKQLQGRGEIETVDGFRIKFPKGWGLLRASNTEPVLSLRFEGETEKDALAYKEIFVSILKSFPSVDMSVF